MKIRLIINLPRRSTIFRCLLFMPMTNDWGCELSQARECAVSDNPSSATGRAWSLGVLVPCERVTGHLSTSHRRTEWSVRYLSSPAAIRLESTGFHATVLHCRACLGAVTGQKMFAYLYCTKRISCIHIVCTTDYESNIDFSGMK